MIIKCVAYGAMMSAVVGFLYTSPSAIIINQKENHAVTSEDAGIRTQIKTEKETVSLKNEEYAAAIRQSAYTAKQQITEAKRNVRLNDERDFIQKIEEKQENKTELLELSDKIEQNTKDVEKHQQSLTETESNIQKIEEKVAQLSQDDVMVEQINDIPEEVVAESDIAYEAEEAVYDEILECNAYEEIAPYESEEWTDYDAQPQPIKEASIYDQEETGASYIEEEACEESYYEEVMNDENQEAFEPQEDEENPELAQITDEATEISEPDYEESYDPNVADQEYEYVEDQNVYADEQENDYEITNVPEEWEEDPLNEYEGPVLTKESGVNYYYDQKETYYNLPMDTIVSIAQSQGIEGEYWEREDGCKMLGDYIMVAANRGVHPQGSLVETSLGTGIVVDTGGFAEENPTQIDIATNW